jgi:hypothetical protein
MTETARWESGASLLGYEWQGEVQPGETITWTLVYGVKALPEPAISLHWFNHLIDAEGNRWGQADGQGHPASQWRVGDTVAVWFDLAISGDAPDPPYWMRVGMYSYPDVANLSLLDEAQNPAGQFVDLGPLPQ